MWFYKKKMLSRCDDNIRSFLFWASTFCFAWIQNSVNRRLDGLLILAVLQQWKFAQYKLKFAKVGSNLAKYYE